MEKFVYNLIIDKNYIGIVTVCEDIVKLANSFIRQKSDILSNSIL